jgi:hypothetical protein
MHYYKLSTTKPIEIAKTEEYFSSLFKSKDANSKIKGITLIDGSMLFLHPAIEEGKAYVEFHCLLNVLPEEKSLSFEGLSWFGEFCTINNSTIKVLRNNNIIPPSGGAIFSDLRSSKAFKQASHAASFPKDLQSLKRT